MPKPEVIVVGITYATEPEDLSAWRFGHFVPEEGSAIGADRFLASLKHEVIPFVEARYRTAPQDRTLLGSSLAGFPLNGYHSSARRVMVLFVSRLLAVNDTSNKSRVRVNFFIVQSLINGGLGL